MSELATLLAQYDYVVPPDLIATTPAHPRDSARLLVYKRLTQSVQHEVFKNIGAHVPKGAVLVCNNTKVIPARLHAKTPGGREVEVFLTRFSEGGSTAQVLSNRHVDAGGALSFENGAFAKVLQKEGKETMLQLDPAHSWKKLLEELGATPIPPYLKHTPLSESELRDEYQTVFAKYDGSVAAPTASLHFTDELLERLKEQGVTIAFVTLHVNLGTFAPLSEESLEVGKLHREFFTVPEETQHILKQAKLDGRCIIPVGTTALRTIESAFDADGSCHNAEGETQLFIREGYAFKMTSGLITNFHVPQSSLMMLVAALVGREKLLELYEKAIAERYRFFSFGDAMLII